MFLNWGDSYDTSIVRACIFVGILGEVLIVREFLVPESYNNNFFLGKWKAYFHIPHWPYVDFQHTEKTVLREKFPNRFSSILETALMLKRVMLAVNENGKVFVQGFLLMSMLHLKKHIADKYANIPKKVNKTTEKIAHYRNCFEKDHPHMLHNSS